MANPDLRLIRIEKHIFGNCRTLLVSPQHPMLVNSREIGWSDGPAQGLVRAKHVVTCLGGTARIAWGKRTIIHIYPQFERHEIIWAEGAATESLFPGPIAMEGMDAESREEIEAIFQSRPDPSPGARREDPSLAREVVPNHVVKKFRAAPI